jgi:ribonuclease VapC
MVVDTSALLAVLQNEADAERYERALVDSEQSLISAATAFEASVVLERRFGIAAVRNLDLLLSEAGIELVPFDAEHLELARAAFRRFGRGKHPAQLNFGDCFTYALAKQRGCAVLFKGNDFAQTDIESAL